MTVPPMPIHDALDGKKTEMDTIQNFLAWLDDNGLAICSSHEDKWEPGAGYVPGGWKPDNRDDLEWAVASLGYSVSDWHAEKDALAKSLQFKGA